MSALAPAVSSSVTDALQKLPESKRRLALAMLTRAPASGSDPVPRPGAAVGTTAPATAVQARLVRWQAQCPGIGTGSRALHLIGPVDTHRLSSALSAVTARHDAFTTRLVPDPSCAVGYRQEPSGITPALRVRSLVDEADPTASLNRLVDEESRRPLDLLSGEGHSFQLVELGPDDYALLLTAHLGLFDGWSSGVLLRELTAAYSGDIADLPPTLSPRDFAAWQQDWLSRQGIPGGVAVGGSAADRGPIRHRERLPLRLDPRAAQAAADIATRERSSVFMVLLSAFMIALAARREPLLGCRDGAVCVGVPTAGRFCSEMETSIGQFSTVVPVTAPVPPGMGLTEMIAQIRPALAAALDGQRTPIDVLCANGQPYGALFAVHNYPQAELVLPDVRAEAIPGPSAQHLDLYGPVPEQTVCSLGLTQSEASFEGCADVNTDLVDPSSILQLVNHLKTVVTDEAARLL